MPLTTVQYSATSGAGKWLQIDQDLETRNGQTVGTSKPTGHSVLVDVRFELPFGKHRIKCRKKTFFTVCLPDSGKKSSLDSQVDSKSFFHF